MRKRKTQKPSVKTSYLNRAIWLSFGLTLLVGAFGLGTVYLRHEAALVANQNKVLYAGISEQKREIAELGAAIARKTTRDELKLVNASMNLNLRTPHDHQIIHVFEDPMKRLYDKQSDALLTVASF